MNQCNMKSKSSLSVVVNYYNPNKVMRVSSMLYFVLESLSEATKLDIEIIVSDGSGFISNDLKKKCNERGWIYLHSDQKIGFADTYNRGMAVATGDYRVWMASDIIVVEGWEKKLISELNRTGAWMAAPYLTSSDYAGQIYNGVIKMLTFSPMAMTFNLNMITKECYEKVGLMSEQFSGCFNDIDYLIRIRQAGGNAIIINAGKIVHISRATLSASSMVNYSVDEKIFSLKYPDLSKPTFGWSYDCTASIFCESKIFRWLFYFCRALPLGRFSFHLLRILAMTEPFFHRR